jgi:hypothetical protein
MRTKITLALLLLNAGLFYFIFYVRHHDDKTVNPTRVLGVEASAIQTIAIRSADASIDTRLERRGDQWLLTAPVAWPANEFAVKNIITELEYLRAETSFAVGDLALSGQALADYGLENPSLTLSFTSAAPVSPGSQGPAPVTLKIGDTTKVGNRLYVLSPDGARIFVVNRSLAETLALKLDDLRSASLFTIPVFEARALNVEPATGARVRIRRDNERWAIESPIQTRAGKVSTELSISGLGSLQVKTFAGEEARDALATPLLRVTLEGNNRRETLLVGAPVPETAPAAARPSPPAAARNTSPAPRPSEPSTDYYARMEKDGGPGAATFITLSIPDRLIATLRDAARELRETRILDFSPENITTLTIDGAGAGGEIVLQRLESNDSALDAAWQIARRTDGSGIRTLPADRETVVRLLRNLARLRVEDLKPPESPFVNDAPSDAEKENYGFNRPAREVTLVFGAPALSSGPVTTPPPPIVLQIGDGVLQPGDGASRRTYARLASQNYVYRVPPRILEEISLSALDYRERVLRELPAGAQITALKLTDLAAPAGRQVVLETALPAPAAAPLREAIDALAAQLRSLRAKTFVSEQFTATVLAAGEERPWRYRLDATISLVGADDGRTTSSTLFFAIRSGGTEQLAGSPEFNTVFAAEQPLLDALFAITNAPRDPGPRELAPPSDTVTPSGAGGPPNTAAPPPEETGKTPPRPENPPALAPARTIPAPVPASNNEPSK